MAGEDHTLNEGGQPPRWAELILERLLAPEDRETVTGDLREEYAEAALPRRGRLGADLWYLWQVVSLVRYCVYERGGLRKELLVSSAFTLMCGLWLASMESLLRHPGYLLRALVDLLIVLVALSTILVRSLRLGIRAEKWHWAPGIALVSIGIQALIRNARSTHFEGFALIISLALMVQGSVMLLSLGRTASPHRGELETGSSP